MIAPFPDHCLFVPFAKISLNTMAASILLFVQCLDVHVRRIIDRHKVHRTIFIKCRFCQNKKLCVQHGHQLPESIIG